MTKKDFVAIAAGIKLIANSAQQKSAAKLMADTCAGSNPRFDRVRFLTACGVKV